MRKILVLAAMLLVCKLPHAEEKQTPTDAFRGTTQFHMLMCKAETLIALNKVELGESTSAIGRIAACIKEGRAGAKKVYPAALSKVSKNPAATKLLKDYYAAWLTSLEGVMPQASDNKLRYNQRLEAAEAKYDEIWNRLQIEAGL